MKTEIKKIKANPTIIKINPNLLNYYLSVDLGLVFGYSVLLIYETQLSLYIILTLLIYT